MEKARLDLDTIIERLREEAAEVERASGRSAVGAAPGPRAGRPTVPLVPYPAASAPASGKSSYHISEFYGLDESDLLDAAYAVVLGRPPDSSGRMVYLPALRNGTVSVARLLGELRWSAEGRARKVHIRNLASSFLLDRLTRLRVVGRFVAPFVHAATLNRALRRVDQRLAAVSQTQREVVASINQSINVVRRTLAELDALGQAVALESRETRQVADSAASELRASRTQIVTQTRQLLGLLHQARTQVSQGGIPESKTAEMAAHALDDLYVAFENRFRGSPEEIGARSTKYLRLMQHNPAVAEGRPVLDIGCGRGEWLALLKSRHVRGVGVDLNEAMVAEARGRGLEVVAADAISHLRSLPAASLGAITGFHIIEHLPFPQLVALLDEANRVLAPEGMILFETPNPEVLVVGAYSFHFDPTHVKPLPPSLMEFLADARGFTAVRIIRSEEDCDLERPASTFSPREIEDWFKQRPDYAIYAQRPQTGEAAPI